MRKILCLIPLFAAAVLWGGDRTELQEMVYHIATLRPDTAVSALRDLAGKTGGFVLTLDDTVVTMRIPAEKLAGVREEIAKIGRVTDMEEYREDLTATIVELKARIKVKEEYLKKIEETLATTGVQDTLEMERAFNQAILDLEALKGQLRLNEHDARYAVVTVYVNPQAGGAVPKKQRWSRWGFVNGLGIQPLLTAGEVAR